MATAPSTKNVKVNVIHGLKTMIKNMKDQGFLSYKLEIGSVMAEQLKNEFDIVISEKQQAINAEEAAVETIFQLCEGLKSIEGMANNALHMATSYNMKIKLEEIAKTAKELRKK